MNRPVNVKNLSFLLLVCLIGLGFTASSQSLRQDTLGLVNKPMTFYFTYRAEPFTDLSYMHFKFREVNDHQLMNSYYKYQKTYHATHAVSFAAGAQLAFAGMGFLINGNRLHFKEGALYTILGTGLITTGISIWLDKRSIKHARKVVGRYNGLVR
ncbi:hypothetical protein [uncultured Imperialibacter sp.]|uniref:hypothetical protein n=1 Tax=uncultured Imperialibacter sp. TaxID=1672639 RepID=UPI0030D8F076|tara:strand:+ start:33 stop:497 length:465 start_codon:yes stop_codon:yes gene_type:complete